MIEFDEIQERGPRIKVIGVGGGGGNAINNMIERGIASVEFVVANTDCQALDANAAEIKLQLGQGCTKGLGAGAKPEVGASAAKESIDRIEELLLGADMVFIAAGMGGGTGTGAAPIIADVARRLGALTVGVVTKPFLFEGNRRRKLAEKGVETLKQSVDTLIVVPNNRLLQLADEQTSMLDAFRMADQVLFNAVKGISDIITQQGIVNVDFADAISVMSDQGMALMGIGTATGEGRAIKAAQKAISSPLLEDVSVDGAMGILVNVTGGPSLTLHEVNAAIELITDAAHEDANIIFGYVVDTERDEEVSITVIATGFDTHRTQKKQEQAYGSMVQHNSLPPLVHASRDIPTFIRKGMGSRDTMAPGVSSYPNLGTKPPQPSSPAVRVPILAPIEDQDGALRPMHQEEAPKKDEYDIPAFLRRNNNDTHLA
jgi:cell division protein FtsZ